jgi:hypothetical protein
MNETIYCWVNDDGVRHRRQQSTNTPLCGAERSDEFRMMNTTEMFSLPSCQECRSYGA